MIRASSRDEANQTPCTHASRLALPPASKTSTPAGSQLPAGVLSFLPPEAAMTDAARQRLLEVFRVRAVSFGHFKLASGKESTYYINSKKALFHSEAAALLGEALYE